MKNLLIVLPRDNKTDIIRTILADISLDADIMIAGADDAAERVNQYFDQGMGLVIAQGHLASVLKSELSVPVIEIVLSGQDMAVLLARAVEIAGRPRPKIAFVGYRHMFSDPAPFEKILNVETYIYPVLTEQELDGAVNRAKSENIDVVIGDAYTCLRAHEAGLKSLVLDVSSASLITALNTAARLSGVLLREQRKTIEVQSVIQNASDAIIRLNSEGKIVLVNPRAEQALARPAKELLGLRLLDLEELSASPQLRQILDSRKELNSVAVQLHHASYMAVVAAVSFEGKNDGWIITLQEFATIDDLDERIRQERIRQGYIARARFDRFPSRSPAILSVLQEAEAYAQYDVPILITGEPRLAKSRFAECIHNASLRRDNPYVAVDVGTIPPDSQFDMLFGHKGSQNTGLISQAHRGTLFLLDVHALVPDCQRQLLSILRSGTFRRANSWDPIPVSIRLICSTFVDLMDLARRDRWMWQLANTLLEINIHMPPIRETPEDIPTYIEEYLLQISRQFKKKVSLTDEAMASLCRYPWPNNLRDVESFCMRAVMLSPDPVVDLKFVQEKLLPELAQEEVKQNPHIVASREELAIRRILKEEKGNRTSAAKRLGISRSTLWRKMTQYGIIPSHN